MEILNTNTLTEDGGKTTLTMILAPVSPTVEKIKTFENSKEMALEGSSGTFYQLDEYLTNIKVDLKKVPDPQFGIASPYWGSGTRIYAK
ncbi:hypothetical protein CN481_15850 [Bacillus sp. AFS006103]|nr:hypothetical protein CN481_15850 [Bacillus sp. AFS006103]